MSDEIPDDETMNKITDSFIAGFIRTSEQDAEFSIHQLVEVALRALSPGINDPYTAIACIDRLGAALCFLVRRKFPSAYWFDSDNILRVISKPVTFKGMVNAAFDQIRHYGGSSVSVTIRLLETLKFIAAQTRSSEHKRAITRQADMMVRGAQLSFKEENDKKDLLLRHEDFLSVFKED